MVLNYLPFFINKTMYNMNKIRLTELLETPYSDLVSNESLKLEITEYYKLVYGVKTCTSCKNNFKKFYDKLMIDGIAKMGDLEEQTPSTQFKMRSDIHVTEIPFGDGLILSPAYADDATVLKFLAGNPNRISLFEVYPEDWKTLLQNNDEENANE